MTIIQRTPTSDLETRLWQHELLRDYVMELLDCTLTQADRLITLREQLETNSEMIERMQEQRRLVFARYLVEHRYLREDLLD